MTTIPKINAPEARDSYLCRIAFFLKYHLLHQDNFLYHLSYSMPGNICYILK